MPSEITFPVYVLAKDCGEITAFSDFQRMKWHFEPIDVENDEYEAWDSSGHILELSVGKPKSEWLKVAQSGRALSERSLAEIKSRAVPYKDPEPLLRGLGRLLGIVKNEPEG